MARGLRGAAALHAARCRIVVQGYWGTKRAMDENPVLGGMPFQSRFSATTPRIPNDDATQDDTVRLAADGAPPPPQGPRLLGRIPRWAILAGTAVVLLALIVPSVLAASTALQDYSALKALGLSGLN